MNEEVIKEKIKRNEIRINRHKSIVWESKLTYKYVKVVDWDNDYNTYRVLYICNTKRNILN